MQRKESTKSASNWKKLLLVVGCWLFVIGCWLLVVGYFYNSNNTIIFHNKISFHSPISPSPPLPINSN
ncbi:MAG TPA: hypothetical protein DCL61_05700 [Cyanobacteria bacterium UBA12227]|nr:hypothetical protein [Cyanobacteria bacterium UBA12227]